MSGPLALHTAAAGADLGAPGGASGGGQGRPQLDRAALTLYDCAPSANGSAAPGAKRGSVPFQFNPKEVTITKSAKWARQTSKGSKKAGPPEFSGPEPSKMTLEMFFDATSARDGSVVQAVEALLACCVATEESAGSKKPSPPLVVLHWGAVSSFPAFVTSVSAKYTLFNSDGTPIRALCSVSLEEMPGEAPRQNPTSGSQEVRRVHRTIAGDTLASVAYAEYGDPNAWRALAAFNDIDDPLRVGTGRVLLLPTAEELAAAVPVRSAPPSRSLSLSPRSLSLSPRSLSLSSRSLSLSSRSLSLSKGNR
ncbi:peptidase M23 [uncultured Friedmanniella sp.]|uniref:CIS tube protein n=1 Tax=uncultured Friedmanniella sp. TaxID=335381 RepID=UPI0035CB68FF